MNFRTMYYFLFSLIVIIGVLLFLKIVSRWNALLTGVHYVEHICVLTEEDISLNENHFKVTEAVCEGLVVKALWSFDPMKAYVFRSGQTFSCHRLDTAAKLAKRGEMPLEMRIYCEIKR